MATIFKDFLEKVSQKVKHLHFFVVRNTWQSPHNVWVRGVSLASPTFLCKLRSGLGFEIMPMTMLIFVNYARLSKTCRNYALLFTLNLVKTPLYKLYNKQVNGKHIYSIYTIRVYVRFPFSPKYCKFRLEIKWNGSIHFGSGLPLTGPLISVSWTKRSLSIWQNYSPQCHFFASFL